MTKQTINIGIAANDKSGDPLRTAFNKVNSNFNELYTLVGGTVAELTELAQDYAAPLLAHAGHTGITISYDDTSNKLIAVVNNAIPTLAGNSGRFLYTSGTTVSWETLPLELPSILNQSAKYLYTNGTTVSWENVLTAASSATFTNKTINIQSGQGNVFQINSVGISSTTGSGNSVVLNSSPTINALYLGNGSNLVVDGGIGSSYWAGSASVSGDDVGGIYRLRQSLLETNSLFTFGANGTGNMSVQIEGSLFVGSTLPSNSGGITTSSPGWLVVQNGGKFGGDINVKTQIKIETTDVIARYEAYLDSIEILTNTLTASGYTGPALPATKNSYQVLILAKLTNPLIPDAAIVQANNLRNLYYAWANATAELEVGDGFVIRDGDDTTWRFDQLTGLRFPNNTFQTTAWTGSVSSLVNGSHTLSLGSTGNTTFPTGLVLGAPRGPNTVNFTSAIDKVFQIETQTDSTGKLWNFGTDGWLTLPANGVVQANTIIALSSFNDTNNIARVLCQSISNTPQINLRTITSTGAQKDWVFSSTGTTTFPTNISINYSGNNVQFPRIIADSGKAFSVQGQGSTGSAALAWAVDPDAASQYAAVSVSRAGGDNLAKVVLQAQSNSGNVATAKTWQFSETGTLTFPDGSNVSEIIPGTGAAASVIVIQSASSIANEDFVSLPPAPISNYSVPGTDIIVNVTWVTNGPTFYSPRFEVVDGGTGHTGGGQFSGGEVLTVPYNDMGITIVGDWTWYVGDLASNFVLEAGLNEWTFGGNGELTFPDATVQTTASVQGEEVFAVNTGATAYAPTAVDFNLLFVTAAVGYSGTNPISVTLPNGVPGQRLVIFNGYNLATLTVNPGPIGRDISSGVVAEFIYSGFDGLWMPLYGTNSPT